MNSPLRILHLEDDPGDARLIHETLKAEGLAAEVTVVDSRASFETALAGGEFHIILADHRVPGFSGLESLALARAKNPQVPFIFVTGGLGEDRAVETLKSGATDFVLKDRLLRLGFAVKRALAEAEEHARRSKAEQTLRWELAVNEAVSLVSTPLISPETTIEQISEAVLSQAMRLTGSKDGLISALDPATKANVCHALTSTTQQACQSSSTDGRIVFPIGADGRYEGICCQALNTRRAFYSNQPIPAFSSAKALPGQNVSIHRLLAVPVLLGKELVERDPRVQLGVRLRGPGSSVRQPLSRTLRVSHSAPAFQTRAPGRTGLCPRHSVHGRGAGRGGGYPRPNRSVQPGL
jgi:CheY-like chemotaxis protein